MIAFTVQSMEAGHSADVLRLARSLGDWFNEEGLRQMERDLESHAGHVALLEGRIVGFATWNPVDPQTANLSWIGVAEELHRQGIGRALVQAVVADLRLAGFRFLEVSTVADSMDYEPYEQTRRFYRALGFADYRVDRDYFHGAEGAYDRLLLRHDLATRLPRHSTEA